MFVVEFFVDDPHGRVLFSSLPMTKEFADRTVEQLHRSGFTSAHVVRQAESHAHS